MSGATVIDVRRHAARRVFIYRHGMSTDPELKSIRDDLARLDTQLVQLIAERVRLACRAGDAKRAAGIPLRDIPREEATLATVSRLARDHALDETAVREVFARLIAIARRAQGAD